MRSRASDDDSMAIVQVTIAPPLADCFMDCEVHCVRDCCGIDAISTDSKLIAGWGAKAGPDSVLEALDQLNVLIAMVENRTHKVSCTFLNHYTSDSKARSELLSFLEAFRSALHSV